VFDRIREAAPLFFLVPGDFQYDNVARDNTDAFEHTYEANLEQPAQQALFLGTPIVYTWDDHDFGGNNADRTTESREAAWQAYRAYVPHGELVNGDTGAIYFAFTQGRVRFVVPDSRSERDPVGTPGRSMLGAEQKAWLKREFLAARDAGLAIAWVSSVPWIDEEREGADTWAGFAEERRELAQFIADNGLTRRVMVLSGDAHMLAADDGTNSNYSDAPGKAFPCYMLRRLIARESEGWAL
jgi:phosphodiesterase/alkaline phosphatase D-like protein